jgi:ATP-dependent RNA helicase SUPV3L1/SUV3
MALRFPDTYRDVEAAMAETERLNQWIEAVLSAQPTGRMLAAAGRNGSANQVRWKKHR